MSELGVAGGGHDVENEFIAESEGEEGATLPPLIERASWLDDASQELDDESVEEFDIVSSPNDWNFATIVNFIDSGALKIPAFQRNFVWDMKRASKLIESMLLGLPVPQVFLYEEGRNNFIVIDGQQRLLSLFFYAKGRFPRPKTRSALRPNLRSGVLDEDFLHDDEYFEAFKLVLPKSPRGKKNRYHGLSYNGLKDDRTSLDLRTMRNIVVKQTSPSGNAAVYEIFSRLNTGGVNLSPQEIRASLYHSELVNSLLDLNLDYRWRTLVGAPSPDARMRDTEFLLRSLALARGLDKFSGSMSSFVNNFCLAAQKYTSAQAADAVDDLTNFIGLFDGSAEGVFSRSNKFSGVLFECFFAAWIRGTDRDISVAHLIEAILEVKTSREFSNTLQEGSTKPVNIRSRVSLADQAIGKFSGSGE
ncbi:DUF262 domain-containing protein [Rhodococcus erythropolis]|nr:DUF262 domain-containing protein [Rhodococcus erythropolis]